MSEGLVDYQSSDPSSDDAAGPSSGPANSGQKRKGAPSLPGQGKKRTKRRNEQRRKKEQHAHARLFSIYEMEFRRRFPDIDPNLIGRFAGSIQRIDVSIAYLSQKNETMIKEFCNGGFNHAKLMTYKEDLRFIGKENVEVYDKSISEEFPVFSVFNTRGGTDIRGKTLPKLIPDKELAFLTHAYLEIPKYRRNLATMRSKQIKEGKMWAYGFRGGFQKGVSFARYVLSEKWNNKPKEVREEAEALLMEWEKAIAGHARFGRFGDDAVGMGGNVTITHDFFNSGHTDADKARAWGLWFIADITGKRSYLQAHEAILHPSYFVLPSLGLAVELYDGVALEWHSGEVIHGTTQAVWKDFPNAHDFKIVGSSTQWTKRLYERLVKTIDNLDLSGPVELEHYYDTDDDDETLADRAYRKGWWDRPEDINGEGKGKGKASM